MNSMNKMTSLKQVMIGLRLKVTSASPQAVILYFPSILPHGICALGRGDRSSGLHRLMTSLITARLSPCLWQIEHWDDTWIWI